MYKEKKIDVKTLSIGLDKLENLAKIVRDNLSTEIGLELSEIVQTFKDSFKEVKMPNISFDKVKAIYLDPDDMEIVNLTTGIDPFRECNWCDLSEFERIDEAINDGDDTKTTLKNFVSDDTYKALKEGVIDYIAFRLDN